MFASPWHSWIARLPPEQKAVGSNPAGDARKHPTPHTRGLFVSGCIPGGFEPMRWKRVKKTARWAVFSVSGVALQRGAVVSRSETESRRGRQEATDPAHAGSFRVRLRLGKM